MIPPLDPRRPERCPLCHVLSETGELQHSDRCTVPAHDAAVRSDALAGLTYESCGTNRLGQPTRRLVGPVEVEP